MRYIRTLAVQNTVIFFCQFALVASLIRAGVFISNRKKHCQGHTCSRKLFLMRQHDAGGTMHIGRGCTKLHKARNSSIFQHSVVHGRVLTATLSLLLLFTSILSYPGI